MIRLGRKPKEYRTKYYTRATYAIIGLVLGSTLFITGCPPKPIKIDPERDLKLVSSEGREIDDVQPAESLAVGLQNLTPYESYRVEVRDERNNLVSFYQLTADREGRIRPSPVWYHAGMVPSAPRALTAAADVRPVSYEEAREALAGRSYQLLVRDEWNRVIARRELPLIAAERPTYYFSDHDGYLRNNYHMPFEPVYLSGRDVPGTAVRLFLVPNRYGWRVGMPLDDVRGESQVIKADNGSFRVMLLDESSAPLGPYDAVIRYDVGDLAPVLREDDVVLFETDTGFLLQAFSYDPAWGFNDFDIAGRLDKDYGYPYFEHHDVFARHEPMWGAVDPAVVPAAHPGGEYAAYYVIDHGTAPSGLTDETEKLEIVPVKKWCINYSMAQIWDDPDTVDEYDVVVDFGSAVAQEKDDWVADGQFNLGVDFIDRATTVGAYVVDDPAVPGPYAVNSWEYAPESSDPQVWTDLSLWTDIFDYCTTPSPLGYTMDHVPLHGLVRYPSGAGPFPLVVIVHGRHNPFEASEPGYNYLLDLLASHGLIAVSIDENFLNSPSSGEMDARAIVVLRHLQRWRDWNNQSGHPFFGKVNMNKIGLAGHSRGGEAVNVAWLFNTTRHNPGDPDHDFGFIIKSTFGIAPVDGQIESSYLPDPSDTGVTLTGDVDYCVMHGSHDGDVSSFGGHRTYDRAHPVSSAANGDKSLLWVYGANHGMWNTEWLYENTTIQPVANRIDPPKIQQDIGKVYIAAFFLKTLNEVDEYEALFAGDVTFDTLPANVTRIWQYQAPDREFLNHYEEDANLATGSYTGVTNDNYNNLLNPYLQKSFYNPGNPHWLWEETQGLVAGWDGTGREYIVNVPAVGTLVDNYPYLVFRVGQIYEETDDKNVTGQLQNFEVQLDLGPSTKSHSLKVSGFDTLPYPDEAFKSGFNKTKTIMKSVRIPLRSFVVNHDDWYLHDISAIRFKFNKKSSGLIAIDEIQLSK